MLRFDSELSGYNFRYPRGWHIMDQRPNLLLLRLVKRGDLIAQCNISPLAPVAPGKQLTLEQFKTHVKKALGKNLGEIRSAEEKATDQGRLYRIVVDGKVQELPIRWNYFLVSDQDGHQLGLVFTLERTLLQKFGDADQLLVKTVQLVAAKPQPQEKSPTKSAQRKAAGQSK